jgi:Zn-dependent M28 family amino/carboxypeptidase
MRNLAALFLVALAVHPAPAPVAAPGSESIRKEDLKADLFFLASDSLRGRLTGTPENLVASELIRSRFERLGLKPAGAEGSYFQPYNLMTAALGAANHLEMQADENRSERYGLGQDFYPQRFSGSGRVRAGVVYVGFGISAPQLGFDDYRDRAAARPEIAGKLVLALEHEPGERDPQSPFDGVVTSEAANPLRKTLAAQEAGAAGILFVSDVHNHLGPSDFQAAAKSYWPAEPRRIPSYMLADWVERVRIPALSISPALASALLQGSGRNLADLARAAETAKGMTPVPLSGARLDLSVEVNRQVHPDRNVVGLIEGGDPQLKDEWIILCAHFDHNGADGEQVWNGADDNGSGTVGLLEIAEAYAVALAAGQRPRRSVLFAAWNSEERGLIGAWAYTERPLWPLSKTVAVLNMDMIGRNEEVPEGGGGRFRGLEIQTAESNANALNLLGFSRSANLTAEIERANQSIGLELKKRYDNNSSNLVRRSDHWPFLQKGVPAIGFHTGLHPDYHTVYDRPEKIHYEKLEKIVRLVHQTSWELAQKDGRPTLTTQ